MEKSRHSNLCSGSGLIRVFFAYPDPEFKNPDHAPFVFNLNTGKPVKQIITIKKEFKKYISLLRSKNKLETYSTYIICKSDLTQYRDLFTLITFFT